MAYTRSTLQILYGSQTGTAQDMAETLAREATKRYFKVFLSSLDEYNVLNLPNESFFIILVSTTGDGEIPDNGKFFWKFLLQKNLSSTSLIRTQSALFGLGDSSYTKFNAPVRKMTTRLQQLGCQILYERGIGDDQSTNGIYSDFDKWCNGLWNYIDKNKVFPLPVDLVINTGPQLMKARYRVYPLPVSLLIDNPSSNPSMNYPLLTIQRELCNKEKKYNYSLSQIYQVLITNPSFQQRLASKLTIPKTLTLNCTEHEAFVACLNAYDALSIEQQQVLQKYLYSVLEQDYIYSKTVERYVYSTTVKENVRLTNMDWNQDVRHITLAFDPNLSIVEESSDSPSLTTENRVPLPSSKYITVMNTDVTPIEINSLSSLVSIPSSLEPNPYYNTGDIAIVFPRNPRDQVDRFISRLGLTKDTVICITQTVPLEDTNTIITPTTDKELSALESVFKTLSIQSSSLSTNTGTVTNNYTTTTTNNINKYNIVVPTSVSSSSSSFSTSSGILPTLDPLPKTMYLPTLITIEHLFTHYLDICSVPKRGMLEQIAFFATKDDEKDKLFEMASVQGNDIYHKYFQQEKRTYVELWEDFLSLHVPLSYLFDWIPLLQPRYFSIASSPYDKNGLGLCVGIVKYTTKYGRNKLGICSNYLQTLQPNDKLSIMIKQDGLLSLSIQNLLGNMLKKKTKTNNNKDTTTVENDSPNISSSSSSLFLPPIIGIGPGTGIAPLRSLWRTVCYLSSSSTTSTDTETIPTDSSNVFAMYFGCRSQTKDWLYYAESSQLAVNKPLHIHEDLLHDKVTNDQSDVITNDTPSSSLSELIRTTSTTTTTTTMGIPSDSLQFSSASVPCLQYHYRVAFSRDTVSSPSSGNPSSSISSTVMTNIPSRIYVQYYLALDSANLYKYIVEQNAYIYICGSAQKMPIDVVNTLKAILKKYGKMYFIPTDDPEVSSWNITDKHSNEYNEKIQTLLNFRIDRYMNTLERTKRLVIEAWS